MTRTTLTLGRALASLGQGHHDRETAAFTLYEALSELATKWLVEPTSGRIYFIDPSERGEVVSRVLLKIVERSPLPVASAAEPQVVAYLRTMLVRAFLTTRREALRRVPLDSDTLARRLDAGADAGTMAPDALTLREADAELELVFEFAAADLDDASRTRARATWTQLKDYAAGRIDMSALVALNAPPRPEVEPDAAIRTRDRVYQRHKRLRDLLTSAARQMVDRSLLSEEQRERVVRSLAQLGRRQITRPGSV